MFIYLEFVTQFIKCNAYRPIFLERINTVLGFTPKERLNHLHMYEAEDDGTEQLPILDP